MSDDWKGESLISAKGTNRRKEATRMVMKIWHRNLKAAGAPNPAAKKHSVFARTAFKQANKIDP